jgi:hypothetical protein
MGSIVNSSRTIRKDIETKNLRKIILKYSKDIPVVDKRHRGVFSIIGYRVYDYKPTGYFVEIDVIFKGDVTLPLREGRWIGSDDKKKYNISTVKIGRYLRCNLLESINDQLGYFSTNISNDYSIKMIKWM